MQSKAHSLIEALVNVVVGYILSVVVGHAIIYPAFGMTITVGQNLGVTAAFVALSLVRSYITRRYFNHHATVTAERA